MTSVQAPLAFSRCPGGGLITITLANAKILCADHAGLAMSKACVVSMISKLFAARLAEAGVAVYQLRPGINRTDMTLPATRKSDALPFAAAHIGGDADRHRV